MNEGRADAAGELLNELRASPKKYVQTVVEATESLITGYIELGSQQLYATLTTISILLSPCLIYINTYAELCIV